MGYGDEIVAAGQAQRVWQTRGLRSVVLDQHLQPRWHDLWTGNPAIVHPHESCVGVHRLVNGPHCRPYIVYPFSRESGWTFNRAFRCRDHVARLYLTEAELRRGARLLDEVGPYVLIEPYTKHVNFRWSMERWEALVASCPDLTFVQHTHAQSTPVRGAHQVPATFREACGLINFARCYVRSESGLCHAAAALGTRQVTLFGGCMDVEVMGRYAGQTCLVDDGPGTPCGRWLPCDHCAAAMDRITAHQVRAAIRATLRKVH